MNYSSHESEQLSFKSPQILNTAESGEKLYSVGGNVNYFSLMKNRMNVSLETKIELSHGPAIPLVCMHSEET